MNRKNTSKILLSLLFATLFNAGFAQKTLQERAKEAIAAKREKKIENSTASAEIRIVERNIEILGNYDDFSDKEIVEESYDKLVARIDTVNRFTQLILEKEPKWKVKSYGEAADKYQEKADRLKPDYDKVVYRKNLKKYILAADKKKNPAVKCKEEIHQTLSYNLDRNSCGEIFHDYYTKELELLMLRKKLVEYQEIDPWMKTSGFKIVETGAYKRIYKKYITNHESWVTETLEEVSKYTEGVLVKETFAEDALQTLWQLNYYSEVVATVAEVDPDKNSRCQEHKTKLQKAIKYVSSIHRKENLVSEETTGKVIFTKFKASREEFGDVEKATSWSVTDPLHFRYFMPKTIAEMQTAEGGKFNDKPYIRAVFFVEDKEVGGENIEFYNNAGAYLNYLTNRAEVEVWDDLIYALMDKGFGTHSLRVELFLMDKNTEDRSIPVASGQIDIVYNSSMKATFKADPSVCVEKAGASNSGLQAQMMSLLKTAKAQKEYSSLEDVTTISTIRIIKPDWYISRHKNTGLIKKKSRVAVALGKDKEGNCVKIYLWYEQQYLGGGKYSSTTLSTIDPPDKIACGCIN